MAFDDNKEPPPVAFPALLSLAEMTLPPETKLRIIERSTARPQAMPVAAEEEQPFAIIEREFPRIAESIHLMWGHVELENYLHELIVTDRGDRAGFPLNVNSALLKLYNQHVSLFKFVRTGDVWSHDPLAKHGLKTDKRTPK